MSGSLGTIDQIRAALQPHGLFVRGSVGFADAASAPRLLDGRIAGSVVLIGNVGSAHWAPFERWRQTDAEPGAGHPLDRWSKHVIKPLAQAFAATAFFPSDPPWQPFQQWAMQAEGLRASPLGILIHPDFGLWHGYRGALGFAGDVSEPAVRLDHACDSCHDRPCLSTCPVSAISETGFDVGRCRTYLKSDAGQGSCMQTGCVARNACPVGAGYRYNEAQLRFHMAALG